MRRRTFLLHLSSAAAICPFAGVSVHSAQAADATILKISHQFPAGTIDEGDFRDRLVRKFAQDVERRTKGSLKFQIYPAGSLMKAVAQFSAVANGSLDMTLYPIAYAGGQVPEVNLGLMPALVTSYEQGLRWKDAPIGKEFERILEEKGVKLLTWVWQAGGIASREKPLVSPVDTKGLKIRGGGRSVDLMLREAGGSIVSMASSEIYSAMQSGVLDAAVTSSTSLISFRLDEHAKSVTTARDKTFWFYLEPLLISKRVFDRLTPEQQKVMKDVGDELGPWGIAEAKKDDWKLAEIYAKSGAEVKDMDQATFEKWRAVAERSAWADFARSAKNGDRLLEMAASVK